MSDRDLGGTSDALRRELQALRRRVTALERSVRFPGSIVYQRGPDRTDLDMSMLGIELIFLAVDPGRWLVMGSANLDVTGTLNGNERGQLWISHTPTTEDIPGPAGWTDAARCELMFGFSLAAGSPSATLPLTAYAPVSFSEPSTVCLRLQLTAAASTATYSALEPSLMAAPF